MKIYLIYVGIFFLTFCSIIIPYHSYTIEKEKQNKIIKELSIRFEKSIVLKAAKNNLEYDKKLFLDIEKLIKYYLSEYYKKNKPSNKFKQEMQASIPKLVDILIENRLNKPNSVCIDKSCFEKTLINYLDNYPN